MIPAVDLGPGKALVKDKKRDVVGIGLVPLALDPRPYAERIAADQLYTVPAAFAALVGDSRSQ